MGTSALPKLQMHFSVNADRGDESQVENPVSNPGNSHKEQCSADEEESVQVYAESCLGEQHAERCPERVLSSVRHIDE